MTGVGHDREGDRRDGLRGARPDAPGEPVGVGNRATDDQERERPENGGASAAHGRTRPDAAVYPSDLPSSSPAFPFPRVPNAQARSDFVIGGQRLSPVPGTESVRSYRLAEFLGHPNQLRARGDPEL